MEGATERRGPVGEAPDARSPEIVDPTDTTVGDIEQERILLQTATNGGRGGLCVPQDVGEGLGDDVVGRRLDLARQASDGDVEGDWEREAIGEVPDRGRKAAIAERGRVDPAGEGAQLTQARLELLARLREDALQRRGGIWCAGRTSQGEPQRDQSLLCAVVEVTFEAASLLVGRLHDPASRGAHLVELRPELGGEALVLDGEPRCGGRALDELRIQGRVVDDDGDRRIRGHHEHRAPLVVLARDIDGRSLRIDVARPGRARECQPEGWVVECPCQGRLQLAGRDAVELPDQVGDRPTFEVGPEQTHKEGGRQQEHS